MTIFVSKLSSLINDTVEQRNIKFSIGYMQIDN